MPPALILAAGLKQLPAAGAAAGREGERPRDPIPIPNPTAASGSSPPARPVHCRSIREPRGGGAVLPKEIPRDSGPDDVSGTPSVPHITDTPIPTTGQLAGTACRSQESKQAQTPC